LDLLETLADELGLEIYAITAEPFSLVSGIMPADRNNLTGIIFDIGGTITDIILVHQGKILGTRVLPLGGRMITEKIADLLKITYEEAENKKMQYVANEIEPTLKRKIKEALEFEIELWVNGVEQSLKDLSESEALPPQFLLCGGGASLPEIKDGLLAHQWTKKLPFSKFPKIEYIVPDNVLTVFDQTKMISDHRLVTAMSLCKVALDLEKEEDATAKMISKTAHKMGI
jgi:cell division ATPase FtsA